jgi:hypothetical protein
MAPISGRFLKVQRLLSTLSLTVTVPAATTGYSVIVPLRQHDRLEWLNATIDFDSHGASLILVYHHNYP